MIRYIIYSLKLRPHLFFLSIFYLSSSHSLAQQSDATGLLSSPKPGSSKYVDVKIYNEYRPVKENVLIAVAGDSAAWPNKKRIYIITAVNIAGYGGSLIALNQAWYANYPRSSFHFFNDDKEWLQVDKIGHGWTAYNTGRLSTAMWRWAGLSEKKAALIGGLSGTAYLTVIEILDGFSSQWGFSWGDMTMNVVGAMSYVGQELGWKEQRIQIKFSYWPYSYPSDLTQRSDELFGDGGMERVLKDYNSQTYWISANLRSFMPDSRIPRWFNVSVGYNARLMLGGTENVWTDENGTIYDYTDIERYRRFFLSVDVDLTKIKTNKKWLRSIFSLVNSIKVPAPAIEYNSKGEFKLHGFYF